jgi:hypothetical protein
MIHQHRHFALTRFYCIHAVIKQSHICCDEIYFCKSLLYSKVTPEHTMKAHGGSGDMAPFAKILAVDGEEKIPILIRNLSN